MNNQEQHKCPNCGANMKKYWHTLSPVLVEVLFRFALISQKTNNRVHVPKDIALTTTEYNNFQKLRYFGLIAKYKENGENVAGYWVLTQRGEQFLKNEKGVPDKVETFRNRICSWSDNYVTYETFNKDQPYVEQKKDFIANSESVDMSQMQLMGFSDSKNPPVHM